MTNDDILYEAKVYAVKLMGKFSYTYRGMVNKLVQKGYSKDIALQVADHYKELGYLEDSIYAQKFIKDAVEFKYHGPARIRYDLKQKGVDEEVIDEAFNELDIDFFEVLKNLVSVKAAGEDLTDRKRRDKLIGYLSRKGFGYYDINEVLAEYSEQEDMEI